MKLGMLFTNVPVDNLMRQFDLGFLEVRRNHTDLFLSFKDVSTELLTAPICLLINFWLPSSTRSTELYAPMYQ